MTHLATLTNVPAAVLPLIAQELGKFAVWVTFEDPYAGSAESISGSAIWRHDGRDALSVWIVVDKGHFPHLMLIGGFRQLVEECLEIFYRYPQRRMA